MKLQGSEVQDHETLQSQIGKIAENRLPLSGLEIFHGRLIESETAGDIPAAGRNLAKPQGCDYLMLLRLVAKDSFAMKVALHQLEARPPGLVGVTAEGSNAAVWSLVKTLQSALDRLVS